ncbi:GNAT family N-acetyltransferase [Oryzibacter oryziterrae]|uniref:GNAT family N-acetyltransferase n=1 Tax=Oryzibacter oryziterrae TaxID=2766474 RepID=UPI001F18A689|nr:GNAT family protein [Oryzibacter oryziterrae]
MTLFPVGVLDPPPVLTGQRIYLRLPVAADYPAWADERTDSAAFLQPWEPTWPADDLTRAAFKRRVKRCLRELRERKGHAFFLFRRDDDALLGGITLSNVRYGVSQCASMGYWMARRHAGQGYMSEAVRLVLGYAYDDLQLHRVEAASRPENTRSIHLLEKAGFVREGYARSYLLIDGKWQDHVLFARLKDSEGADVIA